MIALVANSVSLCFSQFHTFYQMSTLKIAILMKKDYYYQNFSNTYLSDRSYLMVSFFVSLSQWLHV